jgi:F-type H+-transporting ATPase subunit delta
MNQGLISQRYAKALLQYAEEEKQADAVYAEAKAVTLAYRHASQLRTILANPFVPKAEKQKLLLLLAGSNPSKTLSRFVELIIRNEREKSFERIIRRYLDLYRQKNNIHSAKLTSALELDGAIEKRLLNAMQKTIGGSLEVEKNVDSDILGGFVFEVDSLRWDASLSRQLQEIRKELSEKRR